MLAFALTDFKASRLFQAEPCIDARCAYFPPVILLMTHRARAQVQGRTLPKLVLSIGARPFGPHLSLTSLYVLASRVRRRGHLRVLNYDAKKDGARLLAFAHKPALAIWEAGYDGGCWSTEHARQHAATLGTARAAGGKRKASYDPRGPGAARRLA